MRRSSEFHPTIERAREECRLLGHGFVAPEHLLLGLLGCRDNAAAKFLREHRLTLSRLRHEVSEQVGKGEGLFTSEAPPPSLRTLGILRTAEESARVEGIDVDSLSLLWALLRDRDSDVCQLLIKSGVDLSSWAAAVEERIGERTRRRPRTYLERGAGRRVLPAEMRRWKERMQGAKDFLSQHLVGQGRAIDRVVATLMRAWAGLSESRRPLASFLFMGPRGAGKASLARLLAELLYGDAERLLRLDLAEYQGDGAAERLTGSREEPLGLLAALAQEYPYSVLLLENIEQADPRVLIPITHVLGKGYAVDADGHRVSFRDNVVILAAGLDSDQMERHHPLGFRLSSRGPRDIDKLEQELLPDIARALGGEVTEKVDEVVFFVPLEGSEYSYLLERWNKELEEKLWQRRSLRVKVSLAVGEALLAENHPTPDSLRRSFLRSVENLFASEMLKGTIKPGDLYTLDVVDGTFRIQKSS